LKPNIDRQLKQANINNRALDIANAAVRRDLLGDVTKSYFQKTLADITGSSLTTLASAWNPFEIDMISNEGLGIRLIVSDPLVLQLMIDENLYNRAYQIAINAYLEAMTQHADTATDFFTMVLSDLIVESDPYYTPDNEH
jgi:hypothetical protein